MKNVKNYQEAIKLENKFVKHETRIGKATVEVKVILEKRRKRIASKGMTTKQFCNELIKVKLQKIANAMPDEGYSMGSVIKIRFNCLTVRDFRTDSYSGKYKGSETHGSVSISLTLEELKNIQVIGGLVTYIYPNQKQQIKKCWWYEGKGTKQHFELVKVNGFIADSYHSISKDKVRNQIKLWKEWKKTAKINEKRKSEEEKAFKKACRLQFSFEDSINVGNCEVGTKAFILRLRLDSKKLYRGSYLLKQAELKSTSSVQYIKKMIKSKIND